MKTVLVVDDERNIRETLKDVLEDEGYEVVVTEDGKKALEALDRNAVDVVLLDLWLPEVGGMDVLRKVKEDYTDIQVIIVSGHGSIDAAVKATKMGAFDFLEKPLSIERVLNVVDHAIKISGLSRENVELRERNRKNYHMVMGKSNAFREIDRIIESSASSNSRNLITGENGTGKELVARKIHEKSQRSGGPFVAVNCAAIPQTLIEAELFGFEAGAFTGAVKSKRGKFELAHGGTIFLDEIADMSLEAQSKVLRVLEEMQYERVGGVKPVKIDVRVIAATNKDLAAEIKAGRFREDLFYRLNVVPMHVPPLRERREDVPELIEYYLDYFAQEYNKKKKRMDEEAMSFLSDAYPWPGNIRELKNLIERLNILDTANPISIQDVKNNVSHYEERAVLNDSKPLKEATDEFQRQYIGAALKRSGYNVTKASDQLKVERSNLYKLVKRLGIKIK